MSIPPVEAQQIYTDGFSEGYAWRVDDIAHGVVHLTLLHYGVPTDGHMRWPFNRWFALVEKQALTLEEKT
jgi:hypothetical protein